MRSFVLIAALVMASGAAAVPRTFPKRAGGPAVAFDGTTIRATGATPGATLYFAAVVLGGALSILTE